MPEQPLHESQREGLSPRETTSGAASLARTAPAPYPTMSLVAVNGLVFALMTLRGVSLGEPTARELLAWGASFGPAVAEGQWWRVVTAGFLHFGLLHLALNMWCLWDAGRLAERLYGAWAYLAIYLVSLVGGSLTSLAWNPLVVAAGASGAVFGIYGSLLAEYPSRHSRLPVAVFRARWKGAAMFVAGNLFFGLASPEVDNAAHLGGLATGLLAGWCLHRPLAVGWRGPRPRLRWSAGLLALLAALGVGARERTSGLPIVRARWHFERAGEAFEAGELERAEGELSLALEQDAENGLGFFMRADVRLLSGDARGAAADYTRSLELGLDADVEAEVRERLVGALEDSGDYRAAREAVSELVERDPGNANLLARRAWIRLQLEELDAAHADATRAIELDPSEARNHYLRGLIRSQSRDFRGAAEDLHTSIRFGLEPETARDACWLRAWALLGSGAYREAVHAASELVRLAPEEPDSFRVRAAARLMLRELDLAYEDCTRAVELDPSAGWSYLRRCLVSYARGTFQEAIADAERAFPLLGQDEKAGPAAILWACRTRAGDRAGADRWLIDHQRADPAGGPYEQLAAFLRGELDEREFLADVAARDERSWSGQPWELFRALFYAGLRRWSQGDLEGARQLYERAEATGAFDCEWFSIVQIELERLDD